MNPGSIKEPLLIHLPFELTEQLGVSVGVCIKSYYIYLKYKVNSTLHPTYAIESVTSNK